jgi:cytoskeleton protein RodZ
MSDQDENQQDEFVTLGERLKRAREAKGMSLDDVASRTRIPIRHLQNIEREDWDALPAATYAVGFTRNYANAIGLDGAALARELRDRIGTVTHRAAAPEYYEAADPARVPPRSLALIAAILAAVLIGGYLIWRSSLDSEPEAIPVAEAPPPAAAPVRPAAPPVSPQAAAGQPVILVATGEVWLRITDGAGGATIFSGSLAPGDRYQVPATARQPMLRTGRPQNLRATVGAQDLGPLEATEHTIDNVSLRPEDLAARPRVGAPAAAPANAPPGAGALALPPAR